MRAEYAICGDFYDQTIHIRNIGELSLNDILAFSFCYASANGLSGLRIVNEHNYGIRQRGGTHPIYVIEIRDSIAQVNTSTVSISRVIANFWKANPANKLELVPKGSYDSSFECE